MVVAQPILIQAGGAGPGWCVWFEVVADRADRVLARWMFCVRRVANRRSWGILKYFYNEPRGFEQLNGNYCHEILNRCYLHDDAILIYLQ